MKHFILIVMLALLPFSLMGEENQLSQEQLDQMMAPIALYPDALLSQILMASTYPEQVKEAVIWSKEHPETKGEAAVEAVEDEAWDPSVASLVAFPQVLDMMGKNPEWVKSMGDAFLADPDHVMDTVQQLRAKAEVAGNLKSSKEQTVEIEESDGVRTIIIEQATPEVIYVPVYNPRVVYGTWWYPAYPPYYYYPSYYHPAPGVFFGFTFGIAVGNAIWGSFNWHHHDVMINVHRYNAIHAHHKMSVISRHASWKNVVRHYHPRISTHMRPSARDIQRQHAEKAMYNRGINVNREGVQSRKKLDAIYYDKSRNRDFSQERRYDRPQNINPKRSIDRDYKDQKRRIESSGRSFGGSGSHGGGGGRSGEGRHSR